MNRRFCLGALVLAAIVFGGAVELSAQQAPQKGPGAKAPNPPAAAPASPRRTETIMYDSWTVSCQDTVGGSEKKKCSAVLQLIDQNRGKVVLTWVIGFDKDGHLMTVFKIPTMITFKDGDKVTGTGLLVKNGLELKLGNAAVRRLGYVTCQPQSCEAASPMDDGFIKEALAAGTAAVTIYAAAGPSFTFPPIPLAGIDKAVSSVRR